MPDFEKLGAFYLGRAYDPESGEVRNEPLLYDSKDLTTHAVCVGMTGSGKTGLGITLIEEAAIDGIPVIAIDPKGDLGNLLLNFPKLRPEDFRPWVDEGEAAREGRDAAGQARFVADLWRRGIGEWDQKPERIRRLGKAAETVIYTPGSSAGLPLAVLRSFKAPPPELAADPDALRERTLAAVSGLLALAGVDADPVRSREHILLSTLLSRAWNDGRDLDLPSLIRGIQTPPFERLGVMELESFFPSSDRFGLAMTLNNLLASPAFASWSQGEPLEIPRLLYASDGRPRISILSIAHLSEAERMFFVTILLNEVLAWVRTQPGTSSLRALLYMDEVFGYFPPTANPPSKTPMLTLLKQARAYGLGIVLATQNPVDLDYKGLSNAGTWFLGRLQTERDKLRVLDGLEGASAQSGAHFDRARLERTLSGLKSRVFLMNNVHEDEPVLFHTRWALSYLRGPLTRKQISTLMEARKSTPARVSPKPGRTPMPAVATTDSSRPVVPPGIEESFVSARADRGETILYRPALLGLATLHYANTRSQVDEWTTATLLAELEGKSTRSPWPHSMALEGAPDLVLQPEDPATYDAIPAVALRPPTYTRWKKMLASHLYKTRPLVLWRCRELKQVSKPKESLGEFRGRLRQVLRERRDLEMEKLRKRYAPKLARLQDQIRRAEARVEREQSQLRGQTLQSAISIGATVLGAIFGRKLGSVGNVGRATSAARGMGRAARERGDVARARDSVEALERKLRDLEVEFEEDLEAVRDRAGADEPECVEVPIRPRKADLSVDRLSLVWVPLAVSASGAARPCHELEEVRP